MNIFTDISVLLLSVSALFSLYTQYQMLQQNSYYLSRYFSWVKDSYVFKLCGDCFLYCILSVLFLQKSPITASAICLLVLIIRVILAIVAKSSAIKPLVFTGRVKRLYSTAVIVLGAIIALCALLSKTPVGEPLLLFSFMLGSVTPILAALTKIINSPLENLIGRHYIKDARRILGSHRSLKVIGV
ncbi:MAG: hypothetical protein J5852_08115, partial [Clostridia bacterium]|nr:hypothetical protein [Clostridia bacterium]